MRSQTLESAKRWLFLTHRWLGIGTCLLCVMWFLSGLVMLYVPFPAWTDDERSANLPEIRTEELRIAPGEALARAGLGAMPSSFRLEMFGGVPVYRIVAADKQVSLSAVTGAPIAGIGKDTTLGHLEATFPNARPVFLAEIDYDQWTVTRRYDPHRPLLQFSLGDEAGTLVYVSSATGEIVQNATRNERVWNWLGAIPHWIYFSPIRKDQEVWRQSVMWLSGAVIVGSVTGLWIGILRLRLRRPYSANRASPYRGWMKWHHIGGLIGAFFLIAWIFSGWLSVNPFKLFARTQLSEEQRAAFAGWNDGLFRNVDIRTITEAASGAADVAFLSVSGQPLIRSSSATGTSLTDARSGEPVSFDAAMLSEAAAAMMPETPIANMRWLTEETLHWYSHHTKRALPIVEVRFSDSAATSLYIDPAKGEIAGIKDRSARTYRWLFNFLHDYDLPVLLRNQPARDVLIWMLSLAGLVISISGVVLAYRSLRRSVKSS